MCGEVLPGSLFLLDLLLSRVSPFIMGGSVLSLEFGIVDDSLWGGRRSFVSFLYCYSRSCVVWVPVLFGFRFFPISVFYCARNFSGSSGVGCLGGLVLGFRVTVRVCSYLLSLFLGGSFGSGLPLYGGFGDFLFVCWVSCFVLSCGSVDSEVCFVFVHRIQRCHFVFGVSFEFQVLSFSLLRR